MHACMLTAFSVIEYGTAKNSSWTVWLELIRVIYTINNLTSYSCLGGSVQIVFIYI